jgi:protein gp37
MENSKIEWTHHTFNPWIGCAKVSAGCKHCYAEADMDKRRGRAKWGADGTRSATALTYWLEPIKWNNEAAAVGERRRVFCASLADVFEDWKGQVQNWKGEPLWINMNDLDKPELNTYLAALTRGYVPLTLALIRHKLFKLIEATPHLDWLLLTKRAENIMRMVPVSWHGAFPKNVWAGGSAENQERLEKQAEYLVHVPATVRFLSCEPLLGPLKLPVDVNDGSGFFEWVIVGGESSHHARPMHPDWVRSLRDQCHNMGTPFFFKQWGEYLPACQVPGAAYVAWRQFEFPSPHNPAKVNTYFKTGKKEAGRMLDAVEWNEFPNL